jgi:hypothetical protein
MKNGRGEQLEQGVKAGRGKHLNHEQDATRAIRAKLDRGWMAWGGNKGQHPWQGWVAPTTLTRHILSPG